MVSRQTPDNVSQPRSYLGDERGPRPMTPQRRRQYLDRGDMPYRMDVESERAQRRMLRDQREWTRLATKPTRRGRW